MDLRLNMSENELVCKPTLPSMHTDLRALPELSRLRPSDFKLRRHPQFFSLSKPYGSSLVHPLHPHLPLHISLLAVLEHPSSF